MKIIGFIRLTNETDLSRHAVIRQWTSENIGKWKAPWAASQTPRLHCPQANLPWIPEELCKSPSKRQRSQFYSDTIRNSPGNSRQLFSTVNRLLNPQSPSLTATTDQECNNFMVLFKSKTESIRSAPPTHTGHSINVSSIIIHAFTAFLKLFWKRVQDIVRKLNPSTCFLDPSPTAMVKMHISVLSLLITTVINNSSQAGHVPPALKYAIIRPLLKKRLLTQIHYQTTDKPLTLTLDPSQIFHFALKYWKK